MQTEKTKRAFSKRAFKYFHNFDHLKSPLTIDEFERSILNISTFIDEHGLKIQKQDSSDICKIPGGVKAFRTKLLGGPYSGFYCIFIKKQFFLKICLGGRLMLYRYTPLPSSPLTSVCIYDC